MKELIIAAGSNDLIKLKQLLNQPNIELNVVNNYNESALTKAVINKYREAVELLIKQKNINFHIQGYLSGTPLTFALFSDQNDLFKLLLNEEVTFKSTQHPGAINWAILNNQLDTLRALKEKQADFNLPGLTGKIETGDWIWKPEPPEGTTPFHPETLKLISYTPISLAISIQEYEILHYLLEECSADPNQKNVDGLSPLYLAAKNHDKKAVEILLAKGAYPELPQIKDDNVPGFLQDSEITDPEILNLIRSAKEKAFRKPNTAPHLQFFKASIESVIIPEMLLEPYQEAFRAAAMEIEEADIVGTEKRILNEVLVEGNLSPLRLVDFSRQLLLPESLMLPLCVLYCGLHPTMWEAMPPRFSEVKKYLLDNTAAFSLPHNPTTTQLEKCTSFLKTEATKICKEFVKIVELSEEERINKNSIIAALEPHDLSKTTSENPPSPRSFLQSYIDTYKNELEYMAPSDSPSNKTKKFNIHIQTLPPLSRFSKEWKAIYELIKYTPKYDRIRDERHMFNIVRAILWKTTKNSSWRAVPAELEPGSALYFYRRWQKENLLEKIDAILNYEQRNNSSLLL